MAKGAAREAHAAPASAEAPGGSHQHSPEEIGVWASLVATALQAAGARADHASPQDECPVSSPIVETTASAAAEGASGWTAGSCGTGEDSMSAELDLKLGSLSIKHPWDDQPFSSMSVTQEPLTFSSVGALPQQQQQRTRRVVKVVRSAKAPASKVPAVQAQPRRSSSEEQSRPQEASPFLLPCGTGYEPDVAFRKSTQELTGTRTRKKRAAATLMEGTSTFHAPPSAPCEHERSNSNPAGPSEPSGQSCCPGHGLQMCKHAAPSQAPACRPHGSTLGTVPIMESYQHRLPHPMDPLPPLQPHMCSPLPSWPAPSGPMQLAASLPYSYAPYAGSMAAPRAGDPLAKAMQQRVMPASPPWEAMQPGKASTSSSAPAQNGKACVQRPPLLLAAALGRTDVIHTLLSATDYSNPAHPFTDYR